MVVTTGLKGNTLTYTYFVLRVKKGYVSTDPGITIMNTGLMGLHSTRLFLGTGIVLVLAKQGISKMTTNTWESTFSPDKRGEYLVTVKLCGHAAVSLADWIPSKFGGVWDCYRHRGTVIAWMPLPEPFVESEPK